MAYALPRRLVERNDEHAVTVEFVSHRRLFGDAYRSLQDDYFRDMPPESGVFVLLFAPITLFAPAATKPGDVDMLIVPYEGDELVLDRTLAMEIKVVRASFGRPGRSPNEFGISQAAALRALGFPYVAVAHLIISNESPKEAWQQMMAFQVLDNQGNVGEAIVRSVDVLPLTLIDRTYGRLQQVCRFEDIGLLSAFVRYADPEIAAQYRDTAWTTRGRHALNNPHPSVDVMEAVGRLFHAHPEWWMDNPRHG